MTYQEFIREFAPIIQVFGAEHFPAVLLERFHYKIRDLSPKQRTELYDLVLDSCEYAPKIPRFMELANIVRARHREYSPPPQTEPDRRGDPANIAYIRELIRKANLGKDVV